VAIRVTWLADCSRSITAGKVMGHVWVTQDQQYQLSDRLASGSLVWL
jgi:hypothetical protein